ncbi:hypothetical protein TELCIR_12914 [Teladorsagia circumcincta]|uniref:Uncharacterized protein n=1 Tax=Teladorsagia circumcincta TaxID=45464 RepID=A0A2G9U5I0_TELCI|nr:hypothetical protein TELCIR_12914 [Teladorsagia circumcincta]
MLRPSTWLLSAARLTSNDMRYVERVRLLDYWSIQDSALASEFRRSNFVLMVDQLQKKLGDYGLSFDSSNSCLLDAVDHNDNEMFWVEDSSEAYRGKKIVIDGYITLFTCIL